MIWHKNKFPWKLEYSFVLFIVLGIIIFLIPLSVDNSRQVNIIARWNEKINRVEYMFSVINAHITDEILFGFNKTKTSKDREIYLYTLIKPYMRLKNCPMKKHYNVRYLNGARVYKGEKYYFEDLYFAENKTIVGIKDVKTENPDDALFMMMFDMNGFLPPNKWGQDIFGLNIFDGGRIEPFGYNYDMQKLKKDCSKNGTGLSCSYYYKIGGDFEE